MRNTPKEEPEIEPLPPETFPEPEKNEPLPLLPETEPLPQKEIEPTKKSNK